MSEDLEKALEHLRAFEKQCDRGVYPTPSEYEALTEIETLAFYLWRAPMDASRLEDAARKVA